MPQATLAQQCGPTTNASAAIAVFLDLQGLALCYRSGVGASIAHAVVNAVVMPLAGGGIARGWAPLALKQVQQTEPYTVVVQDPSASV